MAKIESIPSAQAELESAKGKTGDRIRQAIEALRNLEMGDAIRLDPGEGESVAEWKRAFAAAGPALGLLVRLKGAGGKLYGWVSADPTKYSEEAVREAVTRIVAREAQVAPLAPPGTPVIGAATTLDPSRMTTDPPYTGADWREIAAGTAIPLAETDPIIKVLLPKKQHGSRWYCNPVTMHTEHEHTERPSQVDEGAMVAFCVWQGPLSRKPTVEEVALEQRG